YIAFKTLGFWKAMIVIVFGVLPHVIFGFLIFYFTKYIPLKYLFVIEVAVLSTIIGSLIVFIYNYVKKGLKAIKQWLWFVLFLITFVYALFVPAPYNMPVIIMVTIMLIFTIVYFSRKKVIRNKKNNKADLIDTHKNHKEGGR
ncbi:chromate transporter, partial [Mycoplasma bovis]|nr:chromate transporter [Mycoplasmopsis bovis]